jgi:redox-sensitive bicupin YhaK (pirin superfamily)
MSAGTGVVHAEYNLEDIDTRLYQIWIEPNVKGVKPRWEAKVFPKAPVTGQLPVLVSGQKQHDGTGALLIHQDAAIYGGTLKKGATVEQKITHQAYVLASAGSFTLNGTQMKQGDGAEVTGEKTLSIVAGSDAEILVIDVPNV